MPPLRPHFPIVHASVASGVHPTGERGGPCALRSRATRQPQLWRLQSAEWELAECLGLTQMARDIVGLVADKQVVEAGGWDESCQVR